MSSPRPPPPDMPDPVVYPEERPMNVNIITAIIFVSIAVVLASAWTFLRWIP